LASSAVRAFVGLGANVGDAESTLRAAVESLAALPDARLVGVSRLYRTKPVGVEDQPDFLNAVVELEVPAGADPATGATDLLVALKGLERTAGRRQRERWGPRELDLDLLLYGEHRLAIERPPEARSNDADADPAKAAKLLEVPHPSMHERLFVLTPLADLAPDLVPSGWGEMVDEARRRRLAAEGNDAVRLVGRWSEVTRGWVRPLTFSTTDMLEPGRYRHDSFEPALSFEVGPGWLAVQDVPGFFDIEREPATPDVIAVQFARPVGAASAADLAAAIAARNGLRTAAPTPIVINDLVALSLVVDAADPDLAANRFVPVIEIALGPISIASGRRIRVDLVDTAGGILAVLVGGSVRGWDAAMQAAEPVLASIQFDRP
jgi:2-amino-4-hydroxy-6-hydroxymethyldihydropteridine diphosphokinase